MKQQGRDDFRIVVIWSRNSLIADEVYRRVWTLTNDLIAVVEWLRIYLGVPVINDIP
jgi:hypothetical protein